MNKVIKVGQFRLIVDKIQPQDLEEILEIERASFPIPWTKGMFRREMEIPFSHMYVLREESSGALTAYGGFWLIRDETHITNLAVHSGFRRRGLGAKLLQFILQESAALGAREAVLEMRPSNLPARELYKKFGFRKIGVRKLYYADGEDALLMHRTLDR